MGWYVGILNSCSSWLKHKGVSVKKEQNVDVRKRMRVSGVAKLCRYTNSGNTYVLSFLSASVVGIGR